MGGIWISTIHNVVWKLCGGNDELWNESSCVCGYVWEFTTFSGNYMWECKKASLQEKWKLWNDQIAVETHLAHWFSGSDSWSGPFVTLDPSLKLTLNCSWTEEAVRARKKISASPATPTPNKYVDWKLSISEEFWELLSWGLLKAVTFSGVLVCWHVEQHSGYSWGEKRCIFSALVLSGPVLS